MSTSHGSLEQFAERLARLEHQNRRLKQCMAGLLILGGLALLTAAQQKKTQSTDSSPFTFRDPQGRVRARMEMGEQGPMLQFLNDKGQPHAAFGGTPNAFQLQFFNNTGGLQTGIALQREGVAMISYTPDGRPHTGANAIMTTGGVLAPP